jgi:Kef-type K+ transport system membrane component KefB
LLKSSLEFSSVSLFLSPHTNTPAHSIIGPTAIGRIPGFTQHIFPSQSLPYLSLVANIGLCFFLFIIGLEIDASIIKRNARKSLFISLSAIALSFSLGAGISVPLYHNFIPSTVKFTYFMLFTGVSFSITAFPVLCRILTALQLLDTTVGVIVLSAGVCNDVVGWSLLALAVALVNATSGLTALWILLVCVAFAAFLLWPVKIALLRFARYTGSTENGPTMFFMTVTMIILWACAFFTDIVGVNAIFGKRIISFRFPWQVLTHGPRGVPGGYHCSPRGRSCHLVNGET